MSDETTHDAPSDQAAERSAEPAPVERGSPGPAVPRRALRPKQQRFVEEYIVDFNGAQAAIRAGYSPRTARAIGAENLTKPYIAIAIREGMEALAHVAGITAERVIRELARIAFTDTRRYSTWGPDGVVLRASTELTEDEAAAVAEVSQTITKDGGTIRFKLHDKHAALVDLGKHLGMFTEKLDVTSNGQTIVQLVSAVPRPATNGARPPNRLRETVGP